jgi:hypothetical protein
MNWIIMPFVDLWEEYTRQAAEDCLTQEGVEPRLLLIANDCSDRDIVEANRWVLGRRGKALIWNHRPALPALGSTWNVALRNCWEAGASEALVVNNDVRLHPQTLSLLSRYRGVKDALFVSAVGVTEDQWPTDTEKWSGTRGGPDYSCFLISKECHERFPFDPELTYCNDLDHHRRIMLAGEGERIFSVNVPYLHYASKTLEELKDRGKAKRLAEAADAHRAYYARKWGGGPNEETWAQPLLPPGSAPDTRDVRTSTLFEEVRKGWGQ